MKLYDVEWQVWEHGTPEAGPNNTRPAAMIAEGKIRRPGASADVLKAEWLKSIKIIFPELTATTTREYIFKAVEVTEIAGWRHCVTCVTPNECDYHQECHDSERFTLDGLPKPGVHINEVPNVRITTYRDDALRAPRSSAPTITFTYWQLAYAIIAFAAVAVIVFRGMQ